MRKPNSCNIALIGLSATSRTSGTFTKEQSISAFTNLKMTSGSNCHLYDYDCSPFAWAHMPYEEGGAK